MRDIDTAHTSVPSQVKRFKGGILDAQWMRISLLIAGFLICLAIPRFNLLNPYYQQILMYVGINIMLTLSLNLVNGFMGEFSVGHAGFMAVGAYVASVITVWIIPPSLVVFLFPLALIAGGLVAAAVGLLVAFPSFRTRGDYLAIVTLALNMIVKSVLENIDAIGGPRGFLGMQRVTNMAWVYVWTVLTVYLIRNYIYSNFGRGVISIREDEIASELIGVRTKQVKMQAFIISSFFAGIAGGLFAHLLQFINPGSFNIIKSTEILVMVYLGGIGSVMGSILGATIYTLLLEMLRFLGLWRWVLAPLLLVLLMILRPVGIMGLKEFRLFVPKEEQALRKQPSVLPKGPEDNGGGEGLVGTPS